MKERLSVYTWVIIIVVVTISVIVAGIIFMPKITKTIKNGAINITGEEYFDEDESGLKTNISKDIMQTKEISEDLEASEIEITSQNSNSKIKFILSNNASEEKKDVLLEIKVRNKEDKDVKIIRETISKIGIGEEKEIEINVEGDIANAKDLVIKSIESNRI